MHSLLLSSGISFQPLTGIRQEKRSEARGLLLASSARCSQWDMSHTYKSKLVPSKSSNNAPRHFWCPSSMLISGTTKEYSKGISILKSIKLKLSYFSRLYYITRWHCSKSFSASLLSSLLYRYYSNSWWNTQVSLRWHQPCCSKRVYNNSANIYGKRLYSNFGLNSSVY